MKTFISTLITLIVPVIINAQNPDSLRSITGKNDTTNVMLGKKEVQITEKNGETDVNVNRNEEEHNRVTENNEKTNDDELKSSENDQKFENNEDSYKEFSKSNKNHRFKGHWDALQIGINSYLTPDRSMSLPASDEFMSLNTNKSINVNLNMFQQSFSLIGSHFGAVTGLGFEFTNYVFDNNNTIIKNSEGIIVPYDPGFKLDKSKLTTTYLTVPLLLEIQFPGDKRSNRLFINAGVVGGIKLGSHTKYKYRENGEKQYKKDRNDFNLSTIRYGIMGKIGLKHLSLYGIYYPVALFEANKGPELYPFMVGISFDGI